MPKSRQAIFKILDIYVRGSLKFTPNMNGKFHVFENQLDICLEVSIDFKHDLGIESGGVGVGFL